MKLQEILTCSFALLFLSAPLRAEDWPMWRHDMARSGSTSEQLATTLHRQWTRELPAPRPAWPTSQFKLQFDASYEPVVAAGRMFVSSNVNDSITAYATDSGKELWRFYTDGPVRFAPAVVDGRVYAVSDDGYLYCLEAASGELQWKYDGAPQHRPILGNGRLVSTWTARGGVVVDGGIAYFAAGIWPSMGVFVHAVDAATGERIWINSDTSSRFVTHPHGADSFGSISPQGALLISGDNLLVPGGRTLPAVFDRHTGKLKHFDFGGKGSGGHAVMAAGPFYVVRHQVFRIEDGAEIGAMFASHLADGKLFGTEAGGMSVVMTSVDGEFKDIEGKDRRGNPFVRTMFTPAATGGFAPAVPGDLFLIAGGHAYLSADGEITVYDLDAALAQKIDAQPITTFSVDGNVTSMLAANGRLLIVTDDARIHCYGLEEPKRAPTYELQATNPYADQSDETIQQTRELLELAPFSGGYAVSLDANDPALLSELLRRSDYQVIVLDDDARAVDKLRREMDAAELYGTRLSAHRGAVESYHLPQYLADLILRTEEAACSVEQVDAIFHSLRPYGGAACLRTTDQQHQALAAVVEEASLENAELTRVGEWSVLRRVGALPNSGQWTHQYGDATNSVVSAEGRVKAPMGVLWFGGPSNDKVLPRHGHGPSPQVAGGRLFIEGPDMMRCVDVYTGRVRWERELTGLGAYYDNTAHHPGAGEIGSNYVSIEDHVYIVYGTELLELDARTGETTKTFTLKGEESGARWGGLAVSGDVLVVTADPVSVQDVDAKKVDDLLEPTRYSTSSTQLVAFDRNTGSELWRRHAAFSFRHNAVCLSDDTVYCIDGMSPQALDVLKRRGISTSSVPQLLALDLHSGNIRWSTEENVFGTFLNYSAEHDLLIQAGSAARDRAKDDVGEGMIAYRGVDGEVLWERLDLKYNGPCLLLRDRIITNGAGGFALNLLTGEETGWGYTRMYGCNTAVGCQTMLTFRSGAAGFFDLAGDSGTGNLGGFRSSCTSNLIPADGVLNAPDYTRTCVCAYQLQTSLAFVHMEDADMWTFNPEQAVSTPLKSVGLNLGAPGDRRDADGVMWFEYPATGGPSPDLHVGTKPESPEWFLQNSLLSQDQQIGWITSSGTTDLTELEWDLEDLVEPGTYTVRLIFAVHSDPPAEAKSITFSLKGLTKLPTIEVEVSGHATIRDITGVEIDDELELTLSPHGILSGIAIIAEK